MKKFIICLLFLLMPFTVSAKENGTYMTGMKEMKPGDTITLYLGFDLKEDIESVQYGIDTTGMIEIVSIDGVNGSMLSKRGENVSQSSEEGLKNGIAWAKIVVKASNEAKTPSEASVNLHNIGLVLKGDSSTTYLSNFSYKIEIKETVEPIEPTENLIQDFSIENVRNFTFDANTKDYQLFVSNTITSLAFHIQLNGENVNYVIDGNELVVGKNEVSVDIVDQNGETTTYVFHVTREESKGEPVVCPECKECHESTWMIVSCILAVATIMEMVYILQIRKEK